MSWAADKQPKYTLGSERSVLVAGSKQNENCLFLLYLEAVSVVTSRGAAAAPAQPANTAW